MFEGMDVNKEETPITMVFTVKNSMDNIHLALRRGLAGSTAQVAVQLPYGTCGFTTNRLRNTLQSGMTYLFLNY